MTLWHFYARFFLSIINLDWFVILHLRVQFHGLFIRYSFYWKVHLYIQKRKKCTYVHVNTESVPEEDQIMIEMWFLYLRISLTHVFGQTLEIKFSADFSFKVFTSKTFEKSSKKSPNPSKPRFNSHIKPIPRFTPLVHREIFF